MAYLMGSEGVGFVGLNGTCVTIRCIIICQNIIQMSGCNNWSVIMTPRYFARSLYYYFIFSLVLKLEIVAYFSFLKEKSWRMRSLCCLCVCIFVRACLYVPTFELLNLLTEFYETVTKVMTLEVTPTSYSIISYSCYNTWWRVCLWRRSDLAPLSIEFSNDAR
jgi:hypothetical protein